MSRADAPGARRSLRELVDASALHPVVIGASKDPNAKITFLLADDSGRAVLAVKAPTTDVAARAVSAELAVLRHVSAVAPPAVRTTIPRIVDVVDHHSRDAAVTTAVAGRPLMALYYARRHTAQQRRVSADFDAVAAWLAALQTATATASRPIDLGEPARGGLAARFADDDVAADLERLDEIREELRAHATPRTVVHGDLWFGNVLVDAGRVSGVVDWEAGAAEGEPLRDVVRFALMYALYLDRRTPSGRRVRGHPGLRADGFGAGVRYALEGGGWFPSIFRRFVRSALERLDAPPGLWRSAVLAGIAEVAAFTDHDEFARLHLNLFRALAPVQAGVLSTTYAKGALRPVDVPRQDFSESGRQSPALR